ncbi:hypothetical protein HGRIS_014769 [Hohenbuehelia grisea]|uniref:histone acetyltransferase n=1 Tax=Hohenbuehelia grisea TaxID=104357 RepID=A0ABR3IQU0_9AGAR
MPKSHVVPASLPTQTFLVSKNGTPQRCIVLQRRAGEVYVHYVDMDKRMDEWIAEDMLENEPAANDGDALEPDEPPTPSRKRRNSNTSTPRFETPVSASEYVEVNGTSEAHGTPELPENTADEVVVGEEEFDIKHHKQITAQRNFDTVYFGEWQIKTWYFSPYPLSESEADEVATPAPTPATPRIPGVSRSTIRAHGRTSDLLAGGLHRTNGTGERAVLWVCDRCFKYMADGLTWELHMKCCTRKHPPGRKVYQRGAHTIWEVDGAKDKLFCQNLSLFGKLFIDIKTLFFDCDNFLFYILTDADSQRDHVLGFFSKEKLSYDDYNLACIITLPPYQRKGYGMLLIEFSYELSRRAGKVGTPERPLSDLGLRSYLTYWVSTIVRFMRRLLSVVAPEKHKLIAAGPIPDFTHPPQANTNMSRGASGSSNASDEAAALTRKKRRIKGWDGEVVKQHNGVPPGVVPLALANDELFTSMRTIEMVGNPDGSASAHVYAKCTLADIARATNMRVEDAAFSMHECGLLQHVRREGGDEGREVIILTREMVESVARERKVKRMMMELDWVLL